VRKTAHRSLDVDLDVPFHDVDALRVVWHGHYYKYAEIGSMALIRSCGFDLDELERLSHRTVVIETRCRHIYPLHYGDRLRVRSWFQDVENRICIGFEILNLTRDRRSAKGHTVLASLDPQGRLLLVTPPDVAKRLR
jgi:acyl-CoA thioester hydrolase